jgi:hypothetical protein
MVVVDINSTSIKYHLTSSFIIDVEKKEDQQIGDASLSGCFKR